MSAVRNKEHLKKDRMFQTLQKQWETHACIYCRDSVHKETKYEKYVFQKRNIFNKMKLSCNSYDEDLGAIDCRSKSTCQHCRGKHHTSTYNDKNKVKKQEKNFTKVQKNNDCLYLKISKLLIQWFW